MRGLIGAVRSGAGPSTSPLGVLRTAVLLAALALAALQAAGCAKHQGGVPQRGGSVERRDAGVEQHPGGMEQIVRVRVFSDHYDIDGTPTLRLGYQSSRT